MGCNQSMAEEILDDLGIPGNLPDAVAGFINGTNTDANQDLKKHGEEGRAAVEWLIRAVTAAHAHPDIKKTARRLAAVDAFTASLQSYGIDPNDKNSVAVFRHFRAQLKTHLATLGARLERLYDDENLGTFFSEDAVDNKLVFPNPEFENSPETTQGMVVPAVENLFDYTDAAPVEDMNEDKFLHAVMIIARLANPGFHARVLKVASRFGMCKKDKSFQESAPKSSARCGTKKLSKEDHRFKSK
jgi:hypothetical protein